jgi:GDP-L-fucose synthase
MLLVQAQSYRQQYGYNAVFLLPVNLYGPVITSILLHRM